MPVTSQLLEPGTPAPDFALLNPVDGRIVRREEFRGRPGLLVMFLSNECPFVRHVLAEVSALARDYEKRGVGIVAINSNDAAMYPHEAPSFMKVLAEREGWAFPYLVDSTQEVAIAFGAVCTPEFFLFGADGRLAYHGQLDDARPGRPVPVTGADLRRALDAVLEGRGAPVVQKPAIGCVIKWRPGSAPLYGF